MTLSKLCCRAALAAITFASCGNSLCLAAPLPGASVIVDTDGEVVATFRGDTAGNTNELYLDNPANALGVLFNNQTTPDGTQVSLGSFTAGTELIFRLHVTNDGSDFFTGPASRNPDAIVHAYADLETNPGEVYVGFEDILGGGDFNFFDLNFSLTNTRAEFVPEPGTSVLCGLGVLLAGTWRRRQRG